MINIAYAINMPDYRGQISGKLALLHLYLTIFYIDYILTCKMNKVEPEFLYDSLDSSIIILINNDGKIVSSNSDVMLANIPDFLRSAMRLLVRGVNVRNLFDIPPDLSLAAIKITRDSFLTETVSYKSRQPEFSAVAEEEGFYSEIPFFNLQLFRLNDEQLIGRVRQANYYKTIAEDGVFNGYVCVDSKERIIAYNNVYLRYTVPGESRIRNSIMGMDLRNFISPTPSEHQEVSRKALTFPSPESMKSTYVEEWPQGRVFKTDDSRSLFYVLPEKIDWEREDFCLEMDFAEGDLPALVIGDLRTSTGEVSDLDGYLIGTTSDKSSFLIKKRSRHFHSLQITTAIKDGKYKFWKIGSQFVLEKEGKVLFYFSDYETVQKVKADLSLLFRAKTRCVVTALRLYLFSQQKSQILNNFLVTAKAHPGSFYLMSLAHKFVRDGKIDTISVYRLQNMSNVKERLTALENGYKEAVERAKAADSKLKALMDDESQFVGCSKSFTVIKNQADKVAVSKATILIQGNTGSGKEVLAKYIHGKSNFAKGPFVKVDCSTLPKSLMESLLFGHEKGSFTGASEKRKGLFEHAEGGTLYLDEASNLELQVQAKLLQFLQDMTVTPVGGKTPIKLNLRIIVATNVHLLDMVKQGLFREDLYYRIAVVVLKLPSLSERMDDVHSLAGHFVNLFNYKYGRDVGGFSPSAISKLLSYDWPGNVRELRNTIERAFLFGASGEIREDDIVFTKEVDGVLSFPVRQKPEGRKHLERITASTDEIKRLFEKHNGIVKRISDELNVTRQTLYNYLKKNNIHVNNIRNIKNDVYN